MHKRRHASQVLAITCIYNVVHRFVYVHVSPYYYHIAANNDTDHYSANNDANNDTDDNNSSAVHPFIDPGIRIHDHAPGSDAV